MKKVRVLSALLSSVLFVSTMHGMSTFATGERIYTDLHYIGENQTGMADGLQEGDVYVDICFDNFDGIRNGRIYIEIGTGFDFIDDPFGEPLYHSIDAPNRGTGSILVDNPNKFVIVFHGTQNASNGTYFRLFLRPNENYAPETAVAQVNCDFLVGLDQNGKAVTYVEYEQSPTMLKSYEYMIADVDGDGRVNSSDASAVLSGISQHSNVPFSVNTINLSFKTWFPNATCAASPDANEDGIINSTDADDIMEYFGEISSGGTGYLNIGKIEVHEIF